MKRQDFVARQSVLTDAQALNSLNHLIAPEFLDQRPFDLFAEKQYSPELWTWIPNAPDSQCPAPSMVALMNNR